MFRWRQRTARMCNDITAASLSMPEGEIYPQIPCALASVCTSVGQANTGDVCREISVAKREREKALY